MAIRQIATSWAGSAIAAAEFEHTVHIWDLDSGLTEYTMETTLDFGGKRLAISTDGACCIVGAYGPAGLAAYSTVDGVETWRRRDLNKSQDVGVSLDDRRIFCCLDKNRCEVVSRDTGKTLECMRGVRGVWESPYDRVRVLEKQSLIIQSEDGSTVAKLPRTTFGVLSVCAGPGFLCISESAGPVRCLDLSTCEERW